MCKETLVSKVQIYLDLFGRSDQSFETGRECMILPQLDLSEGEGVYHLGHPDECCF